MVEFLTSAISNALQHNFVEDDKYTFRGSQLPYCQVRDFLGDVQSKSKSLPKKLVPYRLLNTADIGTAMHRVIQKAMAEKGMLLGDWKCPKCRKFVKMSMPVRCCGEVMDYEEFHLVDEVTGFSGHADAVVPYLDHFLLVDFKTKDPKKIKSIQLQNNYRLQVAAYRYYLTRPPFNIDIRGSAIVYLSREDKPTFKIIEIPPDELADMEFDRYRRQKVQVSNAVETGDTSCISKLCTSPADSPYCPYNYRCFGSEQNALQDYLKTEWQKSKFAQTTNPAPKEG